MQSKQLVEIVVHQLIFPVVMKTDVSEYDWYLELAFDIDVTAYVQLSSQLVMILLVKDESWH